MVACSLIGNCDVSAAPHDGELPQGFFSDPHQRNSDVNAVSDVAHRHPAATLTRVMSAVPRNTAMMTLRP